jgi:ribosomal protein S6--L-glutamate ligase
MGDRLRLAMSTAAETYDRIRSPLEARGIDVEYVQPTSRALPITGKARAVKDGPNTSGATTLDADSFDVGFVYPSRLMEGAVVATRLSVPWVNDRRAVVTSRNKAGVLAALANAGLPVPKTTLISNPVDEETVLEAAAALSFPLVVKPNSATRGVGIAKATDVDSLLGITDYLHLVHDYRATGDKSYLLQEYLPEAHDYRAMVVDGKCVGGVRRELSADARDAGRWKHNVHRGASARGVELGQQTRTLAERVASVLDVDYLGVDFLESGDRLVVSETNARPTVDDAAKYDAGFYDRLADLVRRTAADG